MLLARGGGGAAALGEELGEVALEDVRGDLQGAEGGGDLAEQAAAEQLGLGGGDDAVDLAHGGLGALGGGLARVRQHVAAHELHAAEGAGLEVVVGGEAFFEEEQVGVEFAGADEGEETHLDAGLEREGEQAQGGFLAGAVAVEKALELGVVAAQQDELSLGDGRALRRDGGLETDGPAAQGVELALDQDEGLALAGVGAGAVEVKEQVALGKNGRLGRVDVFGLARVVVLRGEGGLARGEGDHAALVVADRDHEAAAEARLERLHGEQRVVVEIEQAALANGGFGKLFAQHGGAEAAAGGVGEADLELVGELGAEAAVLRPVVAHPRGGLARALEGLVKMLGGELVQIEQLLAQRALLTGRAAAALLVFQGDVETLGEGLDGLGEVEPLGLLDKGEDVARFAAAEAFVETLVGVEVEARRLLLVEGAEGLEFAAAGASRRGDTGDHVNDADAQLEVLFAAFFEARHRRAELHFRSGACSVKGHAPHVFPRLVFVNWSRLRRRAPPCGDALGGEARAPAARGERGDGEPRSLRARGGGADAAF